MGLASVSLGLAYHSGESCLCRSLPKPHCHAGACTATAPLESEASKQGGCSHKTGAHSKRKNPELFLPLTSRLKSKAQVCEAV